MPFARPSLTQLIQRTAADVAARLGLGALLRRGPLEVLARVQAGQAHMLHGHLDFLAEQLMPDTADAEHLERWAAIEGILRKAATYAAGNVTMIGTDGTKIPVGTLLRRADGAEFASTIEKIVASGTASVPVLAVLAGEAGNSATGLALALASPIAGLNSQGTVASPGLLGGADREDDDDLRARLLQKKRFPPQGGAKQDYEKWALEVTGITRAWALPNHLGVGTVGVTFVLDDQAGSILPDGAKVAEVAAYIEARRPVTAKQVSVFAPALSPIDLTIALTPNTAEVKAKVAAALADLITSETTPGGTILVSHLREAISTAEGETDHVLVTPTSNQTAPAGTIHTLGTITWQ